MSLQETCRNSARVGDGALDQGMESDQGFYDSMLAMGEVGVMNNADGQLTVLDYLPVLGFGLMGHNEIAGSFTGRENTNGVDNYRNGDRLINVQAVAEILDCSERTVYRLRDRNIIPPSIEIGGLVKWSYKAIMSWIAASADGSF